MGFGAARPRQRRRRRYRSATAIATATLSLEPAAVSPSRSYRARHGNLRANLRVLQGNSTRITIFALWPYSVFFRTTMKQNLWSCGMALHLLELLSRI
ncbi:hypothetical protein GUJ93_ZPchr0001g31576 [Zizania palustris]|uniref:Uncharacterized protein n=1 Tax=Zizania palustris TaxID=103762 RepID=A0A8J5VPW1_ZIZPA|nr:hypothetical protein GUJ93_ZPchr0001g31576 [Zizania palustris]